MILHNAYLLLLAAACVPGPPTSPLSEADHVHTWVLAHEEEGLRTWFDKSAKGEIIINGEAYPTFIRRAVATGDTDEPMIFDTEHAVLCSDFYSGTALLRVWKVGPDLEGYETPPENTQDISFGTPLNADDPHDALILEWACPELFKDQ